MPDNKLILKIADISIPVSTTEDEAYAVALAEDIDADMRQILDSNTSASVTSAALLCAIDYLDSFRKSNRATNNLRNQIKEYLADAANAKLQYDEECKKNSELTVELGAMRQHLTRIASEGDASGAIEQFKNELAKATAEANRGKKQIADLMGQLSALTEKSNAMNEYISGQDKEIARLNSVINIHLETISSLEEKLRAKQAAPAAAPTAGQAKDEIQSVLDSIRASREAAEKASPVAPAPQQTAPAPQQTAPAPQQTAPAPADKAPARTAPQPAAPAQAVEQTVLEPAAPAAGKAEADPFFHPDAQSAPHGGEPEIIEDLEAPESADPIQKLEEEISSFPFDIDIDDKPEEYFRGEYAVRDRERAEEQARLEKEPAPQKSSAKPKTRDDDMPDLDWTRDL